MNYNNESVCTIVALHHPEMPNSGYIKSGDSFFKHNSIQSLIGLGLYMKSYMSNRTITVSFYDCNGEIIKLIRAKMPQKANFESNEIQILGENGINSKLKHRKAHNSILSGDLVTRTGEDCCRFPESWHVC